MSVLYIVPTPIGNMQDITLRALDILSKADVILAEDTRNTQYLLKHYSIVKPVIAHHKFNEYQSVQKILGRLLAGETLALVSDGGTPLISDPGSLLVRECLANNIKVACLPGATALIPALVNAGFDSEKFCFEGFLPHKKGRQTRLKLLAEEDRTVIIYESPYRLLKTLEQLKEYFGAERKICVCRELTKIYEENVRGTVGEVLQYFSSRQIKGEIVIVIEGKK